MMAEAGAQENGVSIEALAKLAGCEPLIAIDNLHADYGRMRIVHDLSLRGRRGTCGFSKIPEMSRLFLGG